MKRAAEPIENEAKKRGKRLDARSKEGIEISSKLYTEVTTHGRKILPSKIMKYTGCVYLNGKRWATDIKIGKDREYVVHSTQEEAEAYKIEVNIRENLPICNIMYEYNNQYYCLLTQNQMMKFSFANMDVVNAHIWYAYYDPTVRSFYTHAKIGKRGDKYSKAFHRFIMGDPSENESIDHRDRDTLNNNTENLRHASVSKQSLNRDMYKNNTSGTIGVYLRESISWVATWKNRDGKSCCRSFSCLKYGTDEAKALAYECRKENYPNGDPGKGVNLCTNATWIAQWRDHTGRQCSKNFPVIKHGQNAKSMAEEHRKTIESTLDHYRIALQG